MSKTLFSLKINTAFPSSYGRGNVRGKQRHNKGYSLAELLIVIAIIGIVLSAVTVGVSAAMRQYQSAMRRERVNLLYAALYERIVAELRYGTGFSGISADDTPADSGVGGAGGGDEAAPPTITFTSTGMNVTGALKSLAVDENGYPEEGTNIKTENGEGRIFFVGNASTDPTKSAVIPLVSGSSYFSSLSANLTKLEYDSTAKVFNVTLSVKDSNLDEEYTKEHSFSVAPVNLR